MSDYVDYVLRWSLVGCIASFQEVIGNNEQKMARNMIDLI